MRTFFRITLVPLFFLLALASPSLAGDLKGRIADRTGAVLVGASVRLLNVATGEQVSVASDSTGHFTFPSVRVGIYRLIASQPGFSDASRTIVVETDEQAITVDLDLEIGNLRAEVTVSADRRRSRSSRERVAAKSFAWRR